MYILFPSFWHKLMKFMILLSILLAQTLSFSLTTFRGHGASVPMKKPKLVIIQYNQGVKKRHYYNMIIRRFIWTWSFVDSFEGYNTWGEKKSMGRNIKNSWLGSYNFIINQRSPSLSWRFYCDGYRRTPKELGMDSPKLKLCHSRIIFMGLPENVTFNQHFLVCGEWVRQAHRRMFRLHALDGAVGDGWTRSMTLWTTNQVTPWVKCAKRSLQSKQFNRGFRLLTLSKQTGKYIEL